MEGGRTKLESWSATLGAGGRGVIRAAGGLTLRRGESAANPGSSRMICISVVGLSGGEKEKGSMGIGKSCLCNRFIAPLADDYHTDHISVLSQSDFSGRVVNNDHFLYWGETYKTSEDGIDFHVQVVEQTEFIDDASFQPFRASGKQEPYVRRCSSTKLVSAEKLMYICKNQLGLEQEFQEHLMPDGRVSIDGFICVFDVSLVPNRTLEKQVEVTAQLLSNLLKTKKPVVLVTTKNEEGNEIFVREAERLVNRKEFRGLVPLVETSSHENINVDQAFFLIASLVDRSRGRVRILSYAEAGRARREMLELTQEQFTRLVRSEVTDYGASWTVVAKKLSPAPEFQAFLDCYGADAAQRIFRRHVKKLKDTYLSEKVARYLDLLPEVLQELFPNVASLGEDVSHLFHWSPAACTLCRKLENSNSKPWDWMLIQERIRKHPDFDRWFVEYPEDTTWMEANLFDGDSSEHRIPFDVLDSTEAETVYKNLLNQLHQHQQRIQLRKDFKTLLEETGYVTPGKKLDEVRVLFMGRECFETLPEEEIQQIYDIHQQDLVERCKRNFQELLLEKADIFYQFRSSPAGTVTHDDILDITEALADDGRYKALDRLDADRKLLLFQHLGFVHCPIREHCPSYPQCTDALVERALTRRVNRTSWGAESTSLHVLILGREDLGSHVSKQITAVCPNNQFQHSSQIFDIELRRIFGDVSSPLNSFRTKKFNPQGCLCVFNDVSSLEYIRSSLEQALLSNLQQEDRLPFQGLSLILIFQVSESLSNQDLLLLQTEGQNLADSLHCTYIEINQGEREVLSDCLRSLVESIRQKTGLINISAPSDSLPSPDIRVIMCLLCGDPFSIEKILAPLLGSKTCTQTGVRSVLVEEDVRGVTKKVEVILSSYHSATDFRDELVHGFILIFSALRRASLATLSAFSMNIPELPIQVVAVNQPSNTEAAEISQTLTLQGGLLAGQLNAHFVCANIQQFQKGLYQEFFQEVLDKKGEIEKAFALDERLSGRLDDSGEGTLERPPRRNPAPPPRIDSFRTKGPGSLNSRSGSGRSGSGSEIYERLPDSRSHSEDSDIYSQVDSLDREGGQRGRSSKPNGGTKPPLRSENGQPVLKASKSRRKHGWADDSQLPNSRQQAGEAWQAVYGGGAYTTGRRGGRAPPPPLPPGKLNLKEYKNVSAALGRLQVTARNAPLAAVEDLEREPEGGYAVPMDNLPPGNKSVYAQPLPDLQRAKPRSKNRERRERQAKLEISDSESDISSDERLLKKPGAGKRPRKKRIAPVPATTSPPTLAGPTPAPQRTAIPVATPQVPQNAIKPVLAGKIAAEAVVASVRHQPPSPELGLCTDGDSSSSPRPLRSHAPFTFPPPPPGPAPELYRVEEGDRETEQTDKQRKKIEKEEKLRQKELAKQEKKDREKEKKEEREKAKEEKKKEKAEKKVAARQGMKANSVQGAVCMDDFRASEDNPIPVFLSRTIEFIEKEGLDAEGLYRVPGNRAHVDLIFAKFDEDKSLDLSSLDIAVNAVATAVKDFFFKRLPPLLPAEQMQDLESISSMQDRHMKLLELKKLLERIPRTNHAVLKYIFQHFVRVTERSKENCMDSKNLAICWWPTLLQYEFGDLNKFETMRPHLEDVVQTLIDQFRFVFCGQEEVMMV